MPIDKVIVLDDDLIIRKSLEQQLRQHRFEVAATGSIAGARELLGKDTFDMIFLDVRLPDGEGTELLRELQSMAQRPLAVVITGFGSVESAVDCMRNGAFDYMLKPFSSAQLDIVLEKAESFSQLLKVNAYFNRADEEESDLLGQTPAIENLRLLIRKVARTQATVLIAGESGTGKELVARALYRQSPRANAPFIKVNCAAVPENLIESEFFGHEKGAFTGALSKREGRFELAHGGTILLDEISEISPQVQAKLLRVLQERELERVGGNRTIKVDVRVIATTNRHLEESVERKEFRQDLFFRLNVVPIHVPALREHSDDILYLARQFLPRFARKHGVRVRGMSDECLARLEAHRWPGNVRELQNVIERGVILCGDGIMEPEHLGFSLQSEGAGASAPPTTVSPAPATGTERTALPRHDDEVIPLEELEKRHILATLEKTRNNRTHAAKMLGISIRTLRNKLHQYGVGGKDEEPEVE